MKRKSFLGQASLRVGVLTFFCLFGMIGAHQAQGDPGAAFSLGPAMNVARMTHAIANLPGGKVAVFGGHGANFVALGNSELWDPATNSFSLINMNSPRDGSAIAKLQDGRLLLAGGAFNLGVAPGNNTAEIFDPSTSSFESTGSMTYGRTNCNAATLTSGKALIAGGWYDANSCTYADLFDPNTGSFATTGPLNSPRAHPVVLPTSDDKAVILGGMGMYGTPNIEMVELFDPITNTFSVVQENLFVGETGWNILGQPKRPIEAQKLCDGRYILLAWRSAEGVTEYTLFTFDPQTKEITKLISTPALPTSDSTYYYDAAPLVDPTGSKIYLLAQINPPIDPYQYKLFTINTTTGELTIPNESCPLPAADWYPSYAAATVLPGGRLFFTGGTSRQDGQLNFYPVTKTFFALPSVSSRQVWFNDMENRATWSTPLVVNGKVVMQFQDGGVGCYRASDGARIWHNNAIFGGVSSPAYQNGWIYLTGENIVYKINIEDGTVDQQFDAGSYIVSAAPGVSGDLIYFSTAAGFFALDASSLTVSWSKTTGNGNIILNGNILYLMAERLYAFDAENGNELWNIAPNAEDVFINGALYGDILTAVVMSGWDAFLYSYRLSPEPGVPPSLLWTAAIGEGPDYSLPVIDGMTHVAYATTRSGTLYAFALEGDGNPLWTLPVRGEGLAPAQPIAVDGKVFIQKETPTGLTLTCLDGLTGSALWDSDTVGGIAWGEPALVDNVIYLATDWGGLYAFDAGAVAGNWYMVKHNPGLTGSNNGWTPNLLPRPDIKANNSDGPVSLLPGTPVSITIALDPGLYEGFNADWWVAVHTPFDPPGDWYTYVYPVGWMPGVNLCVQTPLFEFSGFEVLDMILPLGSYTFYFAVDPPDGMVTADLLDSVAVRVE